MHIKTILAALAVATLMTACIVTPDDHINQSGRQADPGFSRPPAHDHGGLRPGETPMIIPILVITIRQAQTMVVYVREKITSQIRLIQVLTDQLTLIQGMVVNLNVK
ncbi:MULTISPECIES: hypothetical protein [Acinetobacter]|uniref:Lipoprotein n=1 Tax=Acinetobacter ursingii ANC 3649 TaxID=1257043 RepID=N9C4Z5_9GAMM|nr:MULTISPECIES: hypothetical protein [Acinetobacter]ENV80927.1 hypothetical protein F942_00077 [Acinetobacter ursingii ANC 3649]